MKIVSLIPARSGSKGLPDKNIKLLSGHPLLAYAIKASIKAGLDTYISTDSSAYAELAIKYGAKVPFLRPGDISLDTSSDLEFMQHFLKYLESSGEDVPDLIVHLRPTTPLREKDDISKAIEFFKKSANHSSLLSIQECSETAYKKVEISNEKLVTVFERNPFLDIVNQERQSFPKTYSLNGVVDIIRSESICKGFIHGENVIPFKTAATIEIDSHWDFELLDLYLEKNHEKFQYLWD